MASRTARRKKERRRDGKEELTHVVQQSAFGEPADGIIKFRKGLALYTLVPFSSILGLS